MRAEDWKTIKTVLLETLKLAPTDRRLYLDRADITAEVRAEVESLLAHESSAEDFMSLTASGFARELFDGSEDRAKFVNQRIGIYEIESEIGVGGMGAVYLARRRDGKFEQRVAIKMLKREFNTEAIRRNFKREKEILATLSHPNIASLLDAGTTDDGIPYLVMEYIEGEPIDRYCNERKLSLNPRLKLFNKICEAVAFAHRSLIVHRDLKPSNILVTKEGEPKLLDFGISKLLDAEAEDAGTITHFGAMTPLYASPEQIKGEPVTTATDIYSLGIILFKILTGSFPYNFGNRNNGDLLREITSAEPQVPSDAVVQRHRDAAEKGSGNRKPDDAAVSQVTASQLKGDLDNIVLKSIRKEPEGRYQTVQQLSADIWRFVDGLPVLARPATFSYRARKFYGRNKVSVWAAALILISLCAGIAVAVSQANSARAQARIAAQAQRQAELETERAQAEKQKAERTTRFMQSFLENANPNWYARGKGRFDVTLREAIDDAAGRIDQELANEPEVRADLHYTVGEIYRVAGERELARRHFRQSLGLYRQVHGEQHPMVARGLYYYSMAMDGSGSLPEEFVPLLRQGIAIMRQTGPNNVNLPYMLQHLAGWIMRSERESRNEARLAEAESLILEAKTLFIRHYGENHGSTVTADHTLAMLAQTRGDLARAESIHEETIGRYQEGDFSHLATLVDLAGVKLALGKKAEAERLFEQATVLGRKQWGVDDPRFQRVLTQIRDARTGARN